VSPLAAAAKGQIGAEPPSDDAAPLDSERCVPLDREAAIAMYAKIPTRTATVAAMITMMKPDMPRCTGLGL
jgi:hypothetical protein